jgi:hypothetical protein
VNAISPLERERKNALAAALRQAVWDLAAEQERDPRLADDQALVIGIALQDLKKVVSTWKTS